MKGNEFDVPTSVMRIEAGWKMHLLAKTPDGGWHHADAWCWCGNEPDEPFYPRHSPNIQLKWGPKPE